jgi:uncharacterized protein YutE (UPF0331/DUF86 family)
MPQSYREIFEILANNKLIDENMKNDLIELVRLRNMIPHRYFTITPKRLFFSLSKLKSLRKFADKTEKIVQH